MGDDLWLAAKYGLEEKLRKHLSEPKCDINGLQGSSPLIAATWNNNINCVRLLLDAGAKTSLKGYHGTALDVAYKQGNIEIAAMIEAEESKRKRLKQGYSILRRYVRKNIQDNESIT